MYIQMLVGTWNSKSSVFALDLFRLWSLLLLFDLNFYLFLDLRRPLLRISQHLMVRVNYGLKLSSTIIALTGVLIQRENIALTGIHGLRSNFDFVILCRKSLTGLRELDLTARTQVMQPGIEPMPNPVLV